MPVKLTNNATSTLAASINTSVTSISVQSGDAAKFPSLTAGQWFPITVVDAAGNMEIMRCTARSGAALTVTRAQEGTTAKSFTAGAKVDLRLTAAAMSEFQDTGNLTSGTLPVARGGTGGGTAATARDSLGLTIGEDVQAYDATLAALASFATNGLLTRTGTDTFSGRTLTGTANELTVTNGDGAAGNPTISLPDALTFTGKTVTGGTFSGVSLTGDSTASDQSTSDNSSKVANTKFVHDAIDEAPSGLKLLAEVAASAASQYDFTSLPAGLTHVVVVLNGVVKGTTAASMQMLIGTGGTFTTTGYIAKAVNSINGTSAQGGSSASAFPLQVASGTQTLTGAIDLYRVNTDDWIASGVLATESGIATIGVAGRLTDLGGDLERIRIELTAASFNNGASISIFGE